MSLLSDAKATVSKFLINMGRFDNIMNGDKNTDVTIDGGTIPTLRKLFDYIVTNVVGIVVKGSVNTTADLPAAGNKIGDIYIVTIAGPGNLANDGFVWAGSSWRNIGPIRGPIGPAGPAGPNLVGILLSTFKNADGGSVNNGGAIDNGSGLPLAFQNNRAIIIDDNGYFPTSQPILVNKTKLMAQGRANGTSGIAYSGTGKAITVTPDLGTIVSLRDFDLYASNPFGTSDTAITVKYAEQGANVWESVKIENVRVMANLNSGAAPFSQTWLNGIEFSNVSYGKIDDVQIIGKPDVYDNQNRFAGRNDGSFGIKFSGSNFGSIVNHISYFSGYYYQYGVRTSAYTETVRYHAVEWVGCKIGYSVPETSTPGGVGGTQRAYFWDFSGACHVAVVDIGLEFYDSADIKGAINIQRAAGTYSTGFYGGKFFRCDSVILKNEKVCGNFGATGSGIAVGFGLAGCGNCDIDYGFENLDVAYVIDANCVRVTMRARAHGADANAALNASVNNSPFSLTERIYSDASIIRERGGVGLVEGVFAGIPGFASWSFSGGNQSLLLTGQGVAGVSLRGGRGTAVVFEAVPSTAADTNYLSANSFPSGGTPLFKANGPDATISLGLVPKGAGNVEVYSNIIPSSDNTFSAGLATRRLTQVYAVTPTINTSDERQKTNIRDFTNDELDAWENARFCVFQFIDAVNEKGVNARIHSGLIAQQIEESFAAKNLDVSKYALWCKDYVVNSVEKFSVSLQPKTKKVNVETPRTVIENGKAIIKIEVTEGFENEYVSYPVFNEDGEPVGTWETDDDGVTTFIQAMHDEVIMEEIETPYFEDEVSTTDFILGLRYESCFAFEAAWSRREFSKLREMINGK